MTTDKQTIGRAVVWMADVRDALAKHYRAQKHATPFTAASTHLGDYVASYLDLYGKGHTVTEAIAIVMPKAIETPDA